MTSPEEAAREYKLTLDELVNNNKTQINLLTILAEDYQQYAPAIVDTIDKQIYRVPKEQKLPVMYVTDSILKNVSNDQYKELFAKVIIRRDPRTRTVTVDDKNVRVQIVKKESPKTAEPKKELIDELLSLPPPITHVKSEPDEPTPPARISPNPPKRKADTPPLDIQNKKRRSPRLKDQDHRIHHPPAPGSIYFAGTPRNVIIDGVAHLLNFGDSKTVFIDGEPHVLRFGAPSRELYMGNFPFKGQFGGAPIIATINGLAPQVDAFSLLKKLQQSGYLKVNKPVEKNERPKKPFREMTPPIPSEHSLNDWLKSEEDEEAGTSGSHGATGITYISNILL
uniref:CID domain-containing protein n=1 Tax=Heterorhabditis bacteriophora TaxID=37862 RepID=A0A1I7X767_HETBA